LLISNSSRQVPARRSEHDVWVSQLQADRRISAGKRCPHPEQGREFVRASQIFHWLKIGKCAAPWQDAQHTRQQGLVADGGKGTGRVAAEPCAGACA